ncbi:C-type lectin-like protein [Deerpox virus W-848-83]|uniref:C-type lectin-like protein n=1 Tax=Deerpox virus (strain Mule deer/United States/W-848-83/1983) TaxID=305674 RepID=Q08FK8_DPV83|nr:C-type lectin-like protein [Deerpox virus W-848-83]ABI99299.1 C-type lectin-like protein [Deerpox virus W-848-83]
MFPELKMALKPTTEIVEMGKDDCRDTNSDKETETQKNYVQFTSFVTPEKLYCCIITICILITINLVPIIILMAFKSDTQEPTIKYVTCPKGWIGFGYKCFYFSEDSKNWTFGNTFCTSLGATLVKVETEEELNFLKRYKDSSDHWIGLNRESSNHPWKWADNSNYNSSFVITGTGECAYLNDIRISSSRVYANRKWICSKTYTNIYIPSNNSYNYP